VVLNQSTSQPTIKFAKTKHQINRSVVFMFSFAGPCMNIVSGCVQLSKSLRDFSHDTSNSHYTHKVKACYSCILKSSNHLKHELQRHMHMDFNVKGISPTKGENFFKDGDSAGSPHELSPFGRSSPLPGALLEDHGKGEGNHGRNDLSPSDPMSRSPNDLSPRSTMTSSDISFTTGISR